MAAATMWAGVGKSGSPAPKPITSSPAAFNALALASTARVADSSIAPIRADTRFVVSVMGAIVARDDYQFPRNSRHQAAGPPHALRWPVRLRPLQGAPGR